MVRIGSFSPKAESQSYPEIGLECRISCRFFVALIQQVLDREIGCYMALQFVPSARIGTNVTGRVVHVGCKAEEV